MQEGTISHAGEEAFKRTLLPLSGIISLLSAYASAKLEVFSTTRGASLAFNLLPSPAPDGLKRLMEKSDFTPDGDSRYFRDFLLRSDRSSVVPASICPELHAAIKMENEVLGAIIPGLSLELKELNEETLDDGKPGKRVELLSRRGDIYVPFRCESEGVKKIVSILGRLVDVYSDENACLVIDELDSGIFEFFLCEKVISDHGKRPAHLHGAQSQTAGMPAIQLPCLHHNESGQPLYQIPRFRRIEQPAQPISPRHQPWRTERAGIRADERD